MIMKRIIFALTTALMLCTLAQGKNRTVTENDSLGNKQRVIELKDTVIDGKAVTDTLSIMTYENSSNSNSESDDDYKHHSSAYDFGWNIGHATRDAVIAITAIVFVFGFSVNITSKKSSSGVKSDGSLLVTTTSGCPHLVRFSASI